MKLGKLQHLNLILELKRMNGHLLELMTSDNVAVCSQTPNTPPGFYFFLDNTDYFAGKELPHFPVKGRHKVNRAQKIKQFFF